MKINQASQINLGSSHNWELFYSDACEEWIKLFSEKTGLIHSNVSSGIKRIFCKHQEVKELIGNLEFEGFERMTSGKLDKWHPRRFGDVCLYSNSKVEICSIDSRGSSCEQYLAMWDVMNSLGPEVINHGGMPFHSALIKYKDKGLIIAGPGRTGKTTSCRRIPSAWKPLCDDEAFIVYDKGRYIAHPMPTFLHLAIGRTDRKWDINEKVNLDAIFFLEQAEKDEVCHIGKGEASIRILDGCLQIYSRYLENADKKHMVEKKKIFENACNIAKKLSCYILRAKKDGRFWEEMEKVL